MSDTKKTINKLRALLALAKNNTNEAEANAAISKAQKLAQEYGLSIEDIQKKSEETAKYGVKEVWSKQKGLDYVDKFLGMSIAKFCCTMINVSHDEDGDTTIKFFGHEVDTELAYWLRATIKAAMNFEWEVYRDFCLDSKGDVYSAKHSFMIGMVHRLRERMSAAVRHTQQFSSKGNELIVLKNALLLQKAEEAGFNQYKSNGGASGIGISNSAAYRSGQESGNRVDIGRPVGAGRAPMIAKH